MEKAKLSIAEESVGGVISGDKCNNALGDRDSLLDSSLEGPNDMNARSSNRSFDLGETETGQHDGKKADSHVGLPSPPPTPASEIPQKKTKLDGKISELAANLPSRDEVNEVKKYFFEVGGVCSCVNTC